MHRKIFFLILLLFAETVLALECPPGQYFVSGHQRNSYYRANGIFVSATAVSDHCRPFQFSSPLKIRFQDKMPIGWPYLEKFISLTAVEKKEIEQAFNSLPSRLKNLGEIKIHRAIKSVFRDNPTTSGPDDSIIVLYDSAKAFGFQRAIAHELAHILFSKLNEDEKAEYYSFSDWQWSNGKPYPQRQDFSEPDGIFAPEEDFANNVEHLIQKNNKRVNSKISNYLKSLLGLKK
ncbi:MAG: hypothetical protein HOP07_01195 [Bacteriovoracaceae bacterium]|nr:hypothetical protein [Bacteriovoracaceae bacterium]